jgi:hypothetical protein
MFAFVERINAAAAGIENLALQAVRVFAELRDSVRSIESLIKERSRALPVTVVQVSGVALEGEQRQPLTLGRAIRGQGSLHFQPQLAMRDVVVEIVQGPGLLSEVSVGRRTMVGNVGLMRRVPCIDLECGWSMRVDVGLFDHPMN